MNKEDVVVRVWDMAQSSVMLGYDGYQDHVVRQSTLKWAVDELYEPKTIQKIVEWLMNVTTEVVTKDTAKLIGDKMINIINDYPQDDEDRVGRLGQLAEDLMNNKLPGEE